MPVQADRQIVKPAVFRSKMRRKLGTLYHGALRRFLWIRLNRFFAREKAEPLPHLHFSHKTPLLRKLKDVDMQYQHNKVVNLRIAAQKLDGVVLHPGEILSYWKLIGKPTRRRGFIDGMVLRGGRVGPGVGGGLCQMSNLIFWMTLHTPLTVIERHRHGYDVFPDADRTQPFGSGATCFYPHGDLMIKNGTDADFQLLVKVGEQCLEGEWRSSASPKLKYQVVEKNHEMRGEYWGGYSRRNELYRRIFGPDGRFLGEEFILSNSAVMMYSPYIAEGPQAAADGEKSAPHENETSEPGGGEGAAF